ncbi:helix-turn-helix domain-containing protein [Streptomyces sp. NPDC102487]|uniref:helix-turn-helix domain-containing protein n=1 Tax=Streptomyces sp. NPDC102487 TaxID=3366182 RepID=UPI0037FF0B87
MSTDEPVQWVSTAWINRLRAEVLRVGRDLPEVARVVGIGVWIATYVDEDGSNAWPSRKTLATLAGCSQETVTKAVKVLTGVGVLERKRRPNQSQVFQLLVPLGGGGLDWAAHIHHLTETRQRKAYAKKKAEGLRTASTDAVRTATTDGVPDSVRAGGSGPLETGPDSVHGRPRTASTDAVRNASTDAPTSPSPTSGRDHHPDHHSADVSPQPAEGAGAVEEPGPAASPTLRAVPRPQGGRASAQGGRQDGSSQRPLLLSVRSPAQVSPEELTALRAAATPEELRQALDELGPTQALFVYGHRLMAPYLAALPDHHTGT